MYAKELSERSGATRRQIDYWVHQGVIPSDIHVGSGGKRVFDPNIANRVRLLADISKAFDHRLHGDVLKRIYDCYDEGLIHLGDGLILTWNY